MEQINSRKKEFHGSKNKNGIDKHKPASYQTGRLGVLTSVQYNAIIVVDIITTQPSTGPVPAKHQQLKNPLQH